MGTVERRTGGAGPADKSSAYLFLERYRHYDIPKFFRGDAAFANPALYRLLEQEGYGYAIRIKSNAVLEREIEHLLTRPVGRPSHKPKVFYHSFQDRAAAVGSPPAIAWMSLAHANNPLL